MGLAVSLLAATAASGATALPAAAAPGIGAAWTINAFAGTGDSGFTGDGGPATAAALALPLGIDATVDGDVFIADTFNNRVRRVNSAGIIATVAGSGTPFEGDFSGDGGPATEARLNSPFDAAQEVDGDLLIADTGNGRIRRVDSAGIITTIAGGGSPADGIGDGGPATDASLGTPQQVELDGDGNIYIADFGQSRVRRVDTSGIITTVAGGGTPADGIGDGGPATDAALTNPFDVVAAPDGSLYIADTFANRVRKVDPAGIITTVAGDGNGAYGGDGGPATSAQLNFPGGVELQGSNLYIAEYNNGTVRRVDAAGIIDTVAGSGNAGSSGDGGYGPFARLFRPIDLSMGPGEVLYIADGDANRVRSLATSYVWVRSDLQAAAQGENFTWEMTLSGLPTAAEGVTLKTTLPPEVALVDAQPSQGTCTRRAANLTCDLGTVEAGTAVTVRVTVVGVQTGLIPVKAKVDAADPASIPGPHTAGGYLRIADSDCGKVVTATTRLAEDIGPCDGDGLIVGADDVTVNLNRHRIFGFDGPGDGSEVGIRVGGRQRVTVVNGTISGFDAGVLLNGGGSHTLNNLTVRDNIGPEDVFSAELGDGIAVFDSANNQIKNNVVTGNGVFDGIGVFGELADGNIITNNRVNGNHGPFDSGSSGEGIIVNGAGDNGEPTFISGTVITDNVVGDNGSGGIANINNTDARVERNVVVRNGFTNSFGNGIGVQVGRQTGPVSTGVLVRNNTVRDNGQDGIQVTENALGNRITGNVSKGNGQLFDGFAAGTELFDLRDFNVDCGTNIWRANTWGDALFQPACTTIGGNGPPLPVSADLVVEGGGPGRITGDEATPPPARRRPGSTAGSPARPPQGPATQASLSRLHR